HADAAACFFLDPFTEMGPMLVGGFLANSVVDAGAVLLSIMLDDQIESVRRKMRGAVRDLVISSEGPGVGSDRKKKEEEESLHQQRLCYVILRPRSGRRISNCGGDPSPSPRLRMTRATDSLLSLAVEGCRCALALLRSRLPRLNISASRW